MIVVHPISRRKILINIFKMILFNVLMDVKKEDEYGKKLFVRHKHSSRQST